MFFKRKHFNIFEHLKVVKDISLLKTDDIIVFLHHHKTPYVLSDGLGNRYYKEVSRSPHIQQKLLVVDVYNSNGAHSTAVLLSDVMGVRSHLEMIMVDNITYYKPTTYIGGEWI